MPMIKKIKRDALAELGDEFDVLTDEEVQESGFEVADDEVIVVAKPVPQQEQSNSGDNAAVLNSTRTLLHKANQESANRRILLREANEKLEAERNAKLALEKKLAEHETKTAKEAAGSIFEEYVKEKKHVFISDEAGKDVKENVFNAVDWTKPVTKEILGPAIDDYLGKKKYLLKTVELGSTDAGKQSSNTEGVVDVSLEDIAREFNIPFTAEKEQGA